MYATRTTLKYPPNFGRPDKGPQTVFAHRRKQQVRVRTQPNPIKDFINFKNMTGNEILLNLDNNVNLRNGELISGLLELGKRDKENEFDWNNHAITAKCFIDLKKRLPVMNSTNVIQAAMLMQSLKVID